ncbi:tellurite resistance/C4-dicarboxylate transporter family protein [Neomicrococcus lactis]|uniref:Tellurite resistance protein TehA-like permease n=1 Tax=Neomicrococcus lactis TaxID=732241 RepID=A0A7W9DAH6_9MICC|nr:tellurite resistance protein TehA-like permease [Neomicrococcus lactis]
MHSPDASTQGPLSSRSTLSSDGKTSIARSFASMPPASFAFVMATGIVSTGLKLADAELPSRILFVIAVLGAAILAVGLMIRLGRSFGDVMADLRAPARAFGFFTLVAAANMLSTRFDLFGWRAPALTQAVLGALLWFILTYAVPTQLLFAERQRSIIEDINGSWFLWAVGTQSVALTATMAARVYESALMAAAAVGLWAVGVALYLILATLVTIRLLLHAIEQEPLSPTYWIYMGATAISVLAGAQILHLPSELPVMAATAPIVSGISYMLWAL